MNRDNDMAHTVYPLAEDARAAFLGGRVLADSHGEALEAFFQRNPDLQDRAQTWTVWAGPRATLWHCARMRT